MHRKPLLLAALLAVSPAWSADLVVEIGDIPSAEGSVDVRIHNDTGEEKLGRPILVLRQPAGKDGKSTFRVGGLKQGLYAIVAFHDEDDNGVLTRSTFGVKEASVISNLDSRPWGPPDFREAAFAVPEAGLSISLNLTP